jgi:hypothetical protein
VVQVLPGSDPIKNRHLVHANTHNNNSNSVAKNNIAMYCILRVWCQCNLHHSNCGVSLLA